MLKFVSLLIRKQGIPCALCTIALLSPSLLQAQQPPEAAAAPIPAQIVAARKIFVANAPGGTLPKPLGAPDRTYNEFYAAMKSSGGYELVSSPADADPVFEVSFSSSFSAVTNGISITDYSLRLVIIDPKLNIPLWWFSEPVAVSHRHETLDSVYVNAISALVADVKKLAAPSASAPAGVK